MARKPIDRMRAAMWRVTKAWAKLFKAQGEAVEIYRLLTEEEWRMICWEQYGSAEPRDVYDVLADLGM